MIRLRSLTTSRHALLLRRQLRFLSGALIMDWIVVLFLGFISHYIERQYPYQRPLEPYLDDPFYQFPIEREQVPAGPGGLLDQLTWYLPLVVIVVVAALRKSFHDLHHGVLGLCASRAVMRLTVEFLKQQVGRLRPSFFARCDYDVVEKVCRGSFGLVKDGRKSFPSGHSSTAWQGLVFLSLFLAGKNGAFTLSSPYPRSSPFQSRFLRLSISILPLFLAAWISLTRIQDHWHHPEDVIAGSTIGASCSLMVYLVYYRNPFSEISLPTGAGGGGSMVVGNVGDRRRLRDMELSEALMELGNPKDSYGALERRNEDDQEGDIRLGEDERDRVVVEGEEQA